MAIEWREPEARRLIQQLYRNVLEIEVEARVLRDLVSQLVQGKVSVRVQLLRIIKSDAFFEKHLRGRSPEDMASVLYRYVLGRNVESAETQNGAAAFIAASSWQTQADVMISSEEYLGKYGDDALPPPPPPPPAPPAG
jgi:Phycobilisome Linker polypeptide